MVKRQKGTKGQAAQKVDKETVFWTDSKHFLEGADGDEYNSLDKCFASYGPDDEGEVCCTLVGPAFGPLKIFGDNALKAFNKATIN